MSDITPEVAASFMFNLGLAAARTVQVSSIMRHGSLRATYDPYLPPFPYPPRDGYGAGCAVVREMVMGIDPSDILDRHPWIGPSLGAFGLKTYPLLLDG